MYLRDINDDDDEDENAELKGNSSISAREDHTLFYDAGSRGEKAFGEKCIRKSWKILTHFFDECELRWNLSGCCA